MSQAIFIARSPDHREASEKKLDAIISDIRGITHWRVVPDGVVTVEYNHDETSSNVIEEALAGIGYQVQHVYDTQRLGRADAPNDHIPIQGGGNKYG